MRSIVIIPARYGSSRFPGKPLASLGGKPVIEHVARRVSCASDMVVVATDDDRILSVCRERGIAAVMTRPDHACGTDRIREAYQKIRETEGDFDVVVNVQGDEPFIDPQQVASLIRFFEDPAVEIATLCRPFPKDGKIEELTNPNLVKVVKSACGDAIYFSRSVIPYLRGAAPDEWPGLHNYFTHIGIYAYRPNTLIRITSMGKSPLEDAESLEQLRWLEAGIRIKIGESQSQNIGIDTPEDLARAEERLRLKGLR